MDVVIVDATKDTETTKTVFGVKQYPAIMLLKGELMLTYPIERPEDLSEDALHEWVTSAVEVEKRPPSTVIELVSAEETQLLLSQTPVTLLVYFPGGDAPMENLTYVAEAFPDWRVGVVTAASALPAQWTGRGAAAPAAVVARNYTHDSEWVEYPGEEWSVSALGEFVDSVGPTVVRGYDRETARQINRIVSYSGLAMMIFCGDGDDGPCATQCREAATSIARRFFKPDHINEVTFVLLEAYYNVGVTKFFGLEDDKLPSVILVDSKNGEDGDGTHSNMKVFSIPMGKHADQPCDAGAMLATIEAYTAADGVESELPPQSFDHIACALISAPTATAAAARATVACL